jgi:hypothetical protein
MATATPRAVRKLTIPIPWSFCAAPSAGAGVDVGRKFEEEEEEVMLDTMDEAIEDAVDDCDDEDNADDDEVVDAVESVDDIARGC